MENPFRKKPASAARRFQLRPDMAEEMYRPDFYVGEATKRLNDEVANIMNRKGKVRPKEISLLSTLDESVPDPIDDVASAVKTVIETDWSQRTEAMPLLRSVEVEFYTQSTRRGRSTVMMKYWNPTPDTLQRSFQP